MVGKIKCKMCRITAFSFPFSSTGDSSFLVLAFRAGSMYFLFPFLSTGDSSFLVLTFRFRFKVSDFFCCFTGTSRLEVRISLIGLIRGSKSWTNISWNGSISQPWQDTQGHQPGRPRQKGRRQFYSKTHSFFSSWQIIWLATLDKEQR